MDTGFVAIFADWLPALPLPFGTFGMAVLVAAIVGYLIGSIPFGLLLTRAAGLGDIRAIGSGNIGATNVLRTGNRPLAAATLVLDVLKGVAAVLFARFVLLAPMGEVHGGSGVLYAAAIAVFFGHCFSIWLGFKGGKGVATLIGVLLGICWPVGIAFMLVWLVVALGQRISSLSALTAALTAPIFAYVAWLMDWAAEGTGFAATVALLAVLLFINHRGNIVRLIRGTEPRIGSEKKPDIAG